ncbi:MAG: ribonuclease P protein component [Ilumatobacteraceae bacterium]
MIWRIRARSAFGRLSAEGRRARAGALWCSVLFDPPGTATPPRVAFSVGRALGPAVVRNTVRRRLRAAAQTAQAQGLLPAGDYLIGARPPAAECSYDELSADLMRMLRSLADRR